MFKSEFEVSFGLLVSSLFILYENMMFPSANVWTHTVFTWRTGYMQGAHRSWSRHEWLTVLSHITADELHILGTIHQAVSSAQRDARSFLIFCFTWSSTIIIAVQNSMTQGAFVILTWLNSFNFHNMGRLLFKDPLKKDNKMWPIWWHFFPDMSTMTCLHAHINFASCQPLPQGCSVWSFQQRLKAAPVCLLTAAVVCVCQPYRLYPPPT